MLREQITTPIVVPLKAVAELDLVLLAEIFAKKVNSLGKEVEMAEERR